MKVSCKVKVKNAQGLHARPASVIVRILQESPSNVWFTCKKETVNARSIMSLLTLAAVKNSTVFIEVEGEDAEHILQKLQLAFDDKFGE